MKASDLRTKSVVELQQQLVELLKEQFKLRMQKNSEEMARTHMFKQVRRNIARIKTILNEKEMKIHE
jgi:large subunit ribosomal protein L29